LQEIDEIIINSPAVSLNIQVRTDIDSTLRETLKNLTEIRELDILNSLQD